MDIQYKHCKYLQWKSVIEFREEIFIDNNCRLFPMVGYLETIKHSKNLTIYVSDKIYVNDSKKCLDALVNMLITTSS